MRRILQLVPLAALVTVCGGSALALDNSDFFCKSALFPAAPPFYLGTGPKGCVSTQTQSSKPQGMCAMAAACVPVTDDLKQKASQLFGANATYDSLTITQKQTLVDQFTQPQAWLTASLVCSGGYVDAQGMPRCPAPDECKADSVFSPPRMANFDAASLQRMYGRFQNGEHTFPASGAMPADPNATSTGAPAK